MARAAGRDTDEGIFTRKFPAARGSFLEVRTFPASVNNDAREMLVSKEQRARGEIEGEDGGVNVFARVSFHGAARRAVLLYAFSHLVAGFRRGRLPKKACLNNEVYGPRPAGAAIKTIDSRSLVCGGCKCRHGAQWFLGRGRGSKYRHNCQPQNLGPFHEQAPPPLSLSLTFSSSFLSSLFLALFRIRAHLSRD